MAKYRKRPVVIEAFRLTDVFGDDDQQHSWFHLFRADWHVGRIRNDELCTRCGKSDLAHGWISTLEGGQIVCPGDWIITGIKGEHYACKPDIFEATYEAVEHGGAP